MNDKDIRDFEELLVQDINKSRIPMEVKRLILVDIMQKITFAAEREIERQRNTFQTEDQEK